MKYIKWNCFLSKSCFVLLLLSSNTLYADIKGDVLVLQADKFEHIKFSRIESNDYIFHNQQLKVEVNGSASFLMKPYQEVTQVKQVSFKWRSKGAPKIIDAQHETQRLGDDAVFKIGILLHGEETLFNPFLPTWMKKVEDLLQYPSENIIYLVANAKHKSGEQWLNPYNKRVTMIATESFIDKQGWHLSSHHFDKPIEAVALWLMADGDNTNSSFTVQIKDIKIE